MATSSKIALLMLGVWLNACVAPPLVQVRRHVVTMGTELSVEVRAPGRGRSLQAAEAVLRAVEAAEARLSTWVEHSELARANREADVELSTALAEELRLALDCAEQTEGAFDPTVGPLVEVWGLRTGGRQPSEQELSDARGLVGWRSLDLQGVRLQKAPHVRIEEGGFGKGAALDDAAAQLRVLGVTESTLNFGGQVLRFGDAIWVPLAHPQDRDAVVAEIQLGARALATSGNSERGIVVDGVPRGHLLDPRTGEPVPDFGSLTVLADSGAIADCLSTGLYVMGPEKALEFAARTPGVDVLVVDTRRGSPEIRASKRVTWRPGESP